MLFLLNVIVDALAEILHTTLVYEALPVAYSFGQTNIPADLYFLVANSLTKEELAETLETKNSDGILTTQDGVNVAKTEVFGKAELHMSMEAPVVEEEPKKKKGLFSKGE